MGAEPFILLVEDNQGDIEPVLRTLDGQIESESAVLRGGAEAFASHFAPGAYRGRAARRPSRLILRGIDLPELSGPRVRWRLRERQRARAVPVVRLTPSRPRRDVAQRRGSGANSRAGKPVDFGESSETVRRPGACWLVLDQAP